MPLDNNKPAGLHLARACILMWHNSSVNLTSPHFLPCAPTFAQLVVPLDKNKPDAANMSMVEVGPRMCMNPVKIFAGSFGGATLYENPVYASPNAVSQTTKPWTIYRVTCLAECSSVAVVAKALNQSVGRLLSVREVLSHKGLLGLRGCRRWTLAGIWSATTHHRCWNPGTSGPDGHAEQML